MDLTFELGDPQQPKGHAIIYFRVNTEPDKVYATYAITLPVKADLGKYVPPFLASHLGNMPLANFSAFAMPPLPEAVEGYDQLERLCRMRDDDLIYADSMFSFDLPRMMEAVTEAVQSYSELCERRFQSMGLEAITPAPELEAQPEPGHRRARGRPRLRRQRSPLQPDEREGQAGRACPAAGPPPLRRGGLRCSHRH